MKHLGRFITAACIAAVAMVSMATNCKPQPPEPGPIIEPKLVLDSHYDLQCEGAILTVKMTVATNWTASVDGGDGWCVLNQTSGPAGDVTVTITVSPNTDLTGRDCTVNFKMGDSIGRITISQAQKDTIRVEPGIVECEPEAGSYTVTVTANVDYEVVITADWVSFDNGVITVLDNPLEQVRNATIALIGPDVAATITVTQKAKLPDVDPYECTVTRLQEHTTGAGIPLVIMGDAFTQEEHDDGTFAAMAEGAMEAFLTIEPYSTFRGMFDVYRVDIVSPYYADFTSGNSTVLETYFGEGSYVDGNKEKCQKFAEKAIGEAALDSAVVIVLMNRDIHAGRCFLTFKESLDPGHNEGPCGIAIAFAALGENADDYAALIRHEAGGHGFGKLADEYYYVGTGAISASDADLYRTLQLDFLAYTNIDFTSDPETVRWSYFLKDERYAGEGLGIYRGGATFEAGVWHPSESNIMLDNVAGYDAPSREAIYNRLQRMAFGPGHGGNFEEFAAYDEINLIAEPEPEPVPQRRYRSYSTGSQASCPPPVIIFK